MAGSVLTVKRFKITSSQVNSMACVDIPFLVSHFSEEKVPCFLHPKQAAFSISLIFIILLCIFTFVSELY